jgi:ribA/ribD-fused uncharacterized protein
MRSGQAALVGVLELMGQPLPHYAGEPSPRPMPFRREIALDKLGFHYSPTQPWVLQGLNLRISKGSRVGFIGTTGSGKSTLLDIVMGLLTPTEGSLQIDGVEYPTVEHYFQANKARKFKDSEIEEKILKAKSAKAAKALGKKVKNFNEDEWKETREGIMEEGVRTKFIQHPELRKQLMETGEKVIGEANARDKFWGIGSSVDSDKSKVPSKWGGQNFMGKTLMKLREVFNKMDSDSNKTE